MIAEVSRNSNTGCSGSKRSWNCWREGRYLVHKQEARAQFVAFKSDLRAEVKRLAKLRRRGEFFGFELTDYAPAIGRASADLTVRANSPPGRAWFTALHAAHITLRHPLSWVEKKE
jgi:hypothetical protein